MQYMQRRNKALLFEERLLGYNSLYYHDENSLFAFLDNYDSDPSLFPRWPASDKLTPVMVLTIKEDFVEVGLPSRVGVFTRSEAMFNQAIEFFKQFCGFILFYLVPAVYLDRIV